MRKGSGSYWHLIRARALERSASVGGAHTSLALVAEKVDVDTRSSILDVCSRRMGKSPCRKHVRHVKARHADPVVRHPIINVEAVRRTKIVSAVDARGKYDVVHDAPSFKGQFGRKNRMCRTIANCPWMLFREHHHAGRVT